MRWFYDLGVMASDRGAAMGEPTGKTDPAGRSDRTRESEAFCRHQFGEAVRNMANTVTWTHIVERTIEGKADVVATCEESSRALADLVTTFDRFRVIEAGEAVVIESRAEYRGGDGDVSRVASCDIFDFSGASLQAITSFTAEGCPGPGIRHRQR